MILFSCGGRVLGNEELGWKSFNNNHKCNWKFEVGKKERMLWCLSLMLLNLLSNLNHEFTLGFWWGGRVLETEELCWKFLTTKNAIEVCRTRKKYLMCVSLIVLNLLSTQSPKFTPQVFCGAQLVIRSCEVLSKFQKPKSLVVGQLHHSSNALEENEFELNSKSNNTVMFVLVTLCPER